MLRFARCGFHKKPVRTHYAELVFLHPVLSTGHVVLSGASGARNVDTLFFILGRVYCGSHIKRAGTGYTKLLFLHPVGSAGHVVILVCPGHEM
jgi:hypothetical protein